MISKSPRLLPYIFILALSLFAAACGSTTERHIREGNQAFQDEAYLVALQAYQDAQNQSPDLAEPHYNGANALYREQAFSDALSEFASALELVDGAELEEHGFFNLGNTSYNLEDWEAAVAAYTEALLLDPEDQDAKYNLELAQRNQDQQEEEQNEEQNENDEGSSEENQNQGEGNDSEEKDDAEEQDSSGSEDEPASGNEAAQDTKQSKNSDQQDEEQQNDGEENENAADGSPKQANGSQQEGTENGQNDSYIIKPGERMSQEQARQLLAAIAGNSETLMEKLEQIFVVPFGAPLQDW